MSQPRRQLAFDGPDVVADALPAPPPRPRSPHPVTFPVLGAVPCRVVSAAANGDQSASVAPLLRYHGPVAGRAIVRVAPGDWPDGRRPSAGDRVSLELYGPGCGPRLDQLLLEMVTDRGPLGIDLSLARPTPNP